MPQLNEFLYFTIILIFVISQYFYFGHYYLQLIMLLNKELTTLKIIILLNLKYKQLKNRLNAFLHKVINKTNKK